MDKIENLLDDKEYKVMVEITVSAVDEVHALKLAEETLNNVYQYEVVKVEKIL